MLSLILTIFELKFEDQCLKEIVGKYIKKVNVHFFYLFNNLKSLLVLSCDRSRF